MPVIAQRSAHFSAYLPGKKGNKRQAGTPQPSQGLT
jgi:hypothetical protein